MIKLEKFEYEPISIGDNEAIIYAVTDSTYGDFVFEMNLLEEENDNEDWDGTLAISYVFREDSGIPTEYQEYVVHEVMQDMLENITKSDAFKEYKQTDIHDII